MKCPICNNSIEKLLDFRPYVDVEWSFPMYECSCCRTRMVERNSNINYHDLLYQNYDTASYSIYFDIAKKVKKLLDTGKIEECERYLRLSSKYSKIIDFIYQNATIESSIIEVGCSTGFITAFLRCKGYSIYGIDVSSTSISLAREYFGEYYYLFNDHKLNEVNIIIHCGMIGCVDNPGGFLNYYLNLLTDKGKMYFNAPYNRTQTLKELWCSTPPPDLIYLYSDKSFSFLIDERDYTVFTEIEYEDYTLLVYLKKLVFAKDKLYPKFFIKKIENNKCIPCVQFFKKILKRILKIIEGCLVKSSLVNRLPKEYGMYITLNKK